MWGAEASGDSARQGGKQRDPHRVVDGAGNIVQTLSHPCRGGRLVIASRCRVQGRYRA